MSCFGLLEVSRQRMHSSFMESNYQVCPHCHGQGMVRTIESSTVFVLRGIEEEGIKNRSSKINIFVPSDVAIYLLNQKRQALINLEQKYKMSVIISADDSIKNIADYRIERTKCSANEKVSAKEEPAVNALDINTADDNWQDCENEDATSENEESNAVSQENGRGDRRRRDRRRRGRDRRDRRRRDNESANNGDTAKQHTDKQEAHDKKQEAVILYNSHEDLSLIHISEPTRRP